MSPAAITAATNGQTTGLQLLKQDHIAQGFPPSLRFGAARRSAKREGGSRARRARGAALKG
jgi:hypothetical protein